MSVPRLLIALVAFCSLVVLARVGATGLGEYRRAEQLQATGQLHEAAVHYGRALHMYLPLSPLPGKTADRLISLAEAACAQGNRDECRFCYEEVRSGFLAVRSFYQPGRETIELAEKRLGELMLADERGNWPDRTLTEDRRREIIQAVLEKREDPKLAWVLVMALGYFAWLGGAGIGIWRGLPMDPQQPIAWQQIKRFGGISLLGYLLWLLGVALA